VAWWIAARHPSAVNRLAVVNAPHPAIWRAAMQQDWRQQLKSLYVQFLRIPRLPEFLIRAGDFRGLARVLAGAGVGREELEHYHEAWSQPGTLTAMINWYRAFMGKRLGPVHSFSLSIPTLIIWGTATPTPKPRSSIEAGGSAPTRMSSTFRMPRTGSTTSSLLAWEICCSISSPGRDLEKKGRDPSNCFGAVLKRENPPTRRTDGLFSWLGNLHRLSVTRELRDAAMSVQGQRRTSGLPWQHEKVSSSLDDQRVDFRSLEHALGCPYRPGEGRRGKGGPAGSLSHVFETGVAR
jgi:hypothetical protein